MSKSSVPCRVVTAFFSVGKESMLFDCFEYIDIATFLPFSYHSSRKSVINKEIMSSEFKIKRYHSCKLTCKH